MAYKEHGVWEVLEVLRRIHRGESRRTIKCATGRERSTIRRYERLALDAGWDRTKEPDEELAAKVMAQIKPGASHKTPGDIERLLLEHQEEIKGWLKVDDEYGRGLKLTKVHRLLSRREVRVTYTSLYRFCVKHFDFGGKRTTVRVADVDPGEVAEVDFGRLGKIYDPEVGRERVLHALIVTLVFSRHQYVYVTHSQKIPALIEGLEEAWEFFGGVTRRVIIDNLKAAVLKADRYDPIFQRTFEEYAKFRDFVIDPAVQEDPTGKPHVERQVPYVRDDFFRGEEFLSRHHAQLEAERWCLKTAGTRTHGTTRKHPIEQFEQIEKAALKPLREGRFDTPRWAELKIHPDYHIRFDHALYSVPHQYRTPYFRNRKVTVRADSKLVRIHYVGKLIKTHPLQPQGGRSTDPADYPKERSPYAMRDIHGIIQRARQNGESIGKFTERLLSGDFPWSKLRQAQKLLRLTEKFGAARLETACKKAIEYEIINVVRLERIIEQSFKQDCGGEIISPLLSVQMPLRFLRDPGSFNHNKSKGEQNGTENIAKSNPQASQALWSVGDTP